MTENNKNVISYDQINSVLVQLKNSNRIDDRQLSVLQDYYMKHPVYNTIDDIKKLSADISRMAASAKNMNSVSDTVEVIDFDDSYQNDNTAFDKTNQFNNIIPNATNQFNNINQFNNTKVNSNENYIQNELFILKGEFPNSIISLTDIPHQYILSQNGEDKYFKVEGENGIYSIVKIEPTVNNQSEGNAYGNQKTLGTHPAFGSISWSKDENDVVPNDNKQAAFTNILFFIFLAGLSVGAISMVILKFFIK